MPKFQPSTLPAGAYRVNNKNHDTWIVDADGNIIGQTGANGQDTFFAIAETNPVTGVITYSSGDTVLNSALGSSPGAENTVVLFGDSHWQFSERCQSIIQTTTVTSATHDGLGNATIAFTSFTHECWAGAKVMIQGSADDYWSGEHTVSARNSATSLSFTVDSRAALDLATTKATSVPNIFFSGPSRKGRANPFYVANAKLGNRLKLLANHGANGETTAGQLGRIIRDIVPLRPAWIFYAGGANDVRVAAMTAEQAASNAQLVLVALKTKCPGSKLLFMNWFPDGPSDVSYAAGATAKATVRFNRLMREYCWTNGILYFDEHAVMVSPSSTVGVARTGFLCTDDTHHSSLGGHEVGKELASILSPLIPPIQILSDSLADSIANDASSKQRFRNPLFGTATGGTTGTLTGVAPANVAVSRTGTGTGSVSVPARTVLADGDTLGNNVQVVYTSGAASDSLIIEMTNTTGDFAAGDEVEVSFHLRVSGMSGANCSACAGYLYATVGGNSYLPRYGGAHDIDPALTLVSDIDEVMVLPRFLIPTGGITKIDFRLWPQFGAAGSALTVNIGRPAIRKTN